VRVLKGTAHPPARAAKRDGGNTKHDIKNHQPSFIQKKVWPIRILFTIFVTNNLTVFVNPSEVFIMSNFFGWYALRQSASVNPHSLITCTKLLLNASEERSGK
jgi:hypothetical protein